MSTIILTVAIPSIVSRREQFLLLKEHLKEQCREHALTNQVEIIEEIDNKEMSIGAKRQKLIDRAHGKFLVQLDDDDWVPYEFCKKVVAAAESNPDCIGYLETCQIGAQIKRSVFSIRYRTWADNFDGFDYVRTPFFKSPIRTELCRQVKVHDMRFGEDHQFAKDILPLLKKEVFINEPLYQYRYKFEPHKQKYGIQ